MIESACLGEGTGTSRAIAVGVALVRGHYEGGRNGSRPDRRGHMCQWDTLACWRDYR